MSEESNTQGSLGLAELIAIGVGGMIGGGIFSVLGMAVDIAGHAAPLAFAVGSVVALAAGYSYTKLALGLHSDGASFTYLETAFPHRPNLAGIAGWTVIVGYVGTLALYAYTFGAYGAHLMGAQDSTMLRMALSSGVLASFMGINLVGAEITGRAEDIIVYTKIVLLGIFVAAGLGTVSSENLTPVFERGVSSPFVAGALIFVAFEGFQLITNGVTETRNPERNIPRGIYGSIVITSILYVGAAVVALGNMDIEQLIAAEEYALAVAAGPSLGDVGPMLVDVAALLATSSAINATLFGASRMLAQMASQKRVPEAFSHRTRSRVPWLAIVAITGLGTVFTVFSSLETIATFSSLTFLLVSMGVSAANLKLRKRTKSQAWIIILGLALMGVTTVLLLAHLAETQPMVLGVVAGLFVIIAVAEILFFERTHHHSQGGLKV